MKKKINLRKGAWVGLAVFVMVGLSNGMFSSLFTLVTVGGPIAQLERKADAGDLMSMDMIIQHWTGDWIPDDSYYRSPFRDTETIYAENISFSKARKLILRQLSEQSQTRKAMKSIRIADLAELEICGLGGKSDFDGGMARYDLDNESHAKLHFLARCLVDDCDPEAVRAAFGDKMVCPGQVILFVTMPSRNIFGWTWSIAGSSRTRHFRNGSACVTNTGGVIFPDWKNPPTSADCIISHRDRKRGHHGFQEIQRRIRLSDRSQGRCPVGHSRLFGNSGRRRHRLGR